MYVCFYFFTSFYFIKKSFNKVNPFLFIVMCFYPLLLNEIIIQQGNFFAVYCIVYFSSYMYYLVCSL